MGYLARRLGWLVLFLLTACTARSPAPPPPAAKGPPPRFPIGYYHKAAAAGAVVYRIEPGRSEVTIHVGRAGPLAAIGHRHIVRSRAVRGYALAPNGTAAGSADLYLPVASLELDDPALRRGAGLPLDLSPADVAATRGHMLGAVLDAKHYPYVSVHIAHIEGGSGVVRLPVTLRLHGVAHTLEVPTEVHRTARYLHASGEFTILQSDYGIRPFSAFGGTLRVADRLEVDFDVTGERLPAAPATTGSPPEAGSK